MESITSHIGVVVVAGGSGSRMGGNLPKQFMLLDGQPILARTINNFAAAPSASTPLRTASPHSPMRAT